MSKETDAIERVMLEVLEELIAEKIDPAVAERSVARRIGETFKEQCPDGKFATNARVWVLGGQWQITPEVYGVNEAAVRHLESLGYERPYEDSTETLRLDEARRLVDEDGRIWDAA